MRRRWLLPLVLGISILLLSLRPSTAQNDAQVTRTRNLQRFQLEAGNADAIRTRNLQRFQLESGDTDITRLRNQQRFQLEPANVDITRYRNMQYFQLANIEADVTRHRNLQPLQLCAQLRVNPPRPKAAYFITFTVNVNVTDVDNLYSFEFKLQYDQTHLNATEITLAPFLNPPTTITKQEINQASGYVQFSATSNAPAPPASGSGILATITFIAKPGGNSPLQLLDTQLLDPISEAIPHQPLNGLFEFIPVYGDINADHQVDCYDLFQLAKAYETTHEETNWNPKCDLNDDNKVDQTDLTIFSQNYGKTWDP